MGKEIRPKREELEFIYDLFLKGYKDADVLAKYIALDNDGKLAFPLRSDRRMISKIRDEFEAARTVLEPYLRQQIDPAVQKARDEHLDKIRVALKTWRDSLLVRSIAGVTSSDYSCLLASFAAKKRTPSFQSLNEHLPRPAYSSLWDRYDSWESRYSEYLRLHKQLRQQIVEDAKTRFDLAAQEAKEKQLLEAEARDEEPSDLWHLRLRIEPVFPHVTQFFAPPFFQAFDDSSSGEKIQLEFQNPHCYYVSGNKMVLEGLSVNNHEVLVAENPLEANKSMYESMVKEYLKSDKVADLLAYLSSLREFTDEITIALDEILERRDYIHHTCRLCPASAKV